MPAKKTDPAQESSPAPSNKGQTEKKNQPKTDLTVKLGAETSASAAKVTTKNSSKKATDKAVPVEKLPLAPPKPLPPIKAADKEIVIDKSNSGRPKGSASNVGHTSHTSHTKPEITINANGRSARATNVPEEKFHESDKIPALSSELQHEISGIVLIVVGLIVLFGMLTNQGWVAQIGMLFKKLFGIGAFVIPPLIILMGATFIWEGLTRRERFNQLRLVGVISMLVSFISVIQLLAGNPKRLAEEGGGGGYFAYYINDIVGGIITGFGMFIVWLAVFIIGMMLTFNMSLRDMLVGFRDFWRWLRGAPPLRVGESLDDDYYDELDYATPRGNLAARRPSQDDDFLDDLLMGQHQKPPMTGASANPNERRAGAKLVVHENDEPSFTHSISLNEGADPIIKSAVEKPKRVTANVPPPLDPVDSRPIRPMQQNWKRDQSDSLNNPATNPGLPKREWQPPSLNILANFSDVEINSQELLKKARMIERTLASFGVEVVVREVNTGPTVTQYAIEPGVGVKVARITALANDIALALAAQTIRIEAPVPGQSRVGVEVPNAKIATVGLREIMEAEEYKKSGRLKFALGRDVSGQPIVADLAKMPHLLIAGSTGSGKSVCLNSIVTAFLLQQRPTELQFIMIDPKMVELSTYNGIPHLRFPVVTQIESDPENDRRRNGDRTPTVMSVLKWAIREMERRYKQLSLYGHRNLESYNKAAGEGNDLEKLPYLVLIVDELADLMMVAPEEAESAICRLAQKARAVGIHLILATQRPSVDVVTGLIKANFPTRITFAVTSQIDSRVILDMAGAEKLLGRGDMLYLAADAAKPVRVQGVYVSDEEIDTIVKHWRNQNQFLTGDGSNFTQPQLWPQELHEIEAESDSPGVDELFEEALEVVREARSASTSLLQRRLRIGYNRAARLIEDLAQAGIIGPADGSKPRSVLLDEEDFSGTHSLTAAASSFEPMPPSAPTSPLAQAVPAASRPFGVTPAQSAANSSQRNGTTGSNGNSAAPARPFGITGGKNAARANSTSGSADFDPDPPL